ncbi:hypothetical protein AB0I22_19850 [Streptomyces sp. NPDC050610]|uniref:hypothetical protein n=1 Tax=Streptomyces sp. NPDC050610 TaxID=3157097 RepID=UPI0034263BE9
MTKPRVFDLGVSVHPCKFDAFLRQGSTTTVEYDNGQPGTTSPDMNVDWKATLERYIARAKELDGRESELGEGDSVADTTAPMTPGHVHALK